MCLDHQGRTDQLFEGRGQGLAWAHVEASFSQAGLAGLGSERLASEHESWAGRDRHLPRHLTQTRLVSLSSFEALSFEWVQQDKPLQMLKLTGQVLKAERVQLGLE